MKIGLNAMQFQRENSGIGQYIKSLYTELVPQLQSNLAVEEIIIYQTRKAPSLPGVKDYPKVRIAILPVSKQSFVTRALYEQSVLPLRLKNDKVDLYFSPDTKLPWIIPARMKTIVVLHDLCVFRWPEEYQISRVWYWQRVFARSLHRADRIIAVSDFTGREAQNVLGIGRIQVVHNGVEKRFQPINDTRQLMRVSQKYKLPQNFILFVGQLSPRKNLRMLLTSFALMQNRFPELEMVVVGSPGWKNQQDRAAVASLGIAAKIHFTGYVDDADLAVIYNLACVLVYPSLYEGFGMPPLESMACGTLCVASNTSSIPEVTQGSALLVEPQPDQIADAITRVLLMESDEKQQWQKRGREHAAGFSWNRAARETYHTIIDALI